MLAAVVEDFARIPGIHVITLLDDRHPEPLGHDCRRKASHLPFHDFHDCVVQSDAVLLIAPEFMDILTNLSHAVLWAGRRLLGCFPEAVELAGDKLTTARYWESQHVPTPIVAPATASIPEFAPPPWVCKPRHGAGSQATFLVRQAAEWSSTFERASGEWPMGDLMVQAYVAGSAASVAFLIGPGGTVPLVPAAQHLTDDGRFSYRGGRIALPTPLGQRAMRLAQDTIAGIDGLQGYVGVDLVLGVAEDGSEDYAIEINPRLTTSYIGLRQVCRSNLAAAWLDVMQRRTVTLRWDEGPVAFAADGSLRP
jgi:predicted ATP-grasp superfamily ATP-dependent carboligase